MCIALCFAVSVAFCEEPLSEQDQQKIDKFIHIILTDPQNPALYEMVERIAEDLKQLTFYLESYFDEKIKKRSFTLRAQDDGLEPPLHYHLIRLHFRLRQMTKDSWPTLTEELEKIKTAVEKLEDRNFRKLYYRITVQCLEQMPDRKGDLAHLYRTEVLPHWKDYAVEGQETLFKALLQFYFDESDPKTAQWTRTILNQLLDDLFEGRDLPFLHLTFINDTAAPFFQKRSLLKLIEERIKDRSLLLQTQWQRLKWELDALRKEELFMTLSKWDISVKNSFEEYLSLIKNFQPDHWLRLEMEPALLAYLSLGAEWDERRQKSYFEETAWKEQRKEAIRLWIPFVAEEVDESLLVAQKTSQEKEQIPLPAIVRVRLILAMPDELKMAALEESPDFSALSVREFNILNRISFDRDSYFKFKLLTRYLELLKEHSQNGGIVHEQKMSLFSTVLTHPLLNDEMFDLILEMVAKAELTSQQQLDLYSTCLEHPYLKEKAATQVIQRLHALKIDLPAEAIRKISTIHSTFLNSDTIPHIMEMIYRKNLPLDEQLALFSTLLANPHLDEKAIVPLIKELGKTKSDRAIRTLEKFLSDQPVRVIEASAQALIDIGKASVPSLINILKQDPCYADFAVIDALVQLGDDSVLPLIETYQQIFAIDQCLNDEKDVERTNAQYSILQTLKQIGSPTSKNFLISVANDVNDVLCHAALQAVTEIDHDLGLHLTIQHLELPDYSIPHKIGVIHIFTETDPQNLSHYLIKKLQEGESEASRLILETLKNSFSPKDSEILLSCLRVKENSVRIPIVDALIEIGDEATLRELVDALSDSIDDPLILHLSEMARDSKDKMKKSRIEDVIKRLNKTDSF